MSIIKLFESFDTGAKTEEEKDIYMSRKDAFRKLGNITKKTALASLPLAAFTAMPKMAFAAKRDAVDVLNFALTLEHLEYRFYQMGIDAGIIAAEDQAVFNVIRDHELAHVQLLQETINALGGTPVEEPQFDFTAGGTFPDPFTDGNYPIFLALSQGFEDTGVRAYKGQAGNIMENDDLLTVALQIHSVEARHASQVRRIRLMKGLSDPNLKGWITEPDYDGINGFEAATAPIYAGEMNTTHLDLDVTTVTEVPDLAVEEGWDEPLSQEAVLNIASPFIVQ